MSASSAVVGGGVIPELFRGLFDDAAVFPPGNLPVAEAVPAHRAHRAAWYAEAVGPLLCGAGRLGELARRSRAARWPGAA